MTEKYDMPDALGHFGPYGGIFVAETLMPAITELNQAYQRYIKDPEFIAELERIYSIMSAGRRRCIMRNAGAGNWAERRFI